MHVGACETRSSAAVKQDTGGQRQVHQQVRHGQVNGIDYRRALLFGAEAKNIKCNCVEKHAHLENKKEIFKIKEKKIRLIP